MHPATVTIAVAAVLHAASSQTVRSPAIEVNAAGNMVFSAAEDAEVKVRRYNRATGRVVSEETVVTASELSAAVSAGVSAAVAATGDLELQTFNSFADVTRTIDVNRAAASSAMTVLRDELSTISGAVGELQSGQPAGNCPNYTLVNGTAFGAGLGHGAIRVLQCDEGSVLVPSNASRTTICHTDNTWSDGGSTRCVLAGDVPLPPSPDEMVTCCIVFNQQLQEAWVDGERTRVSRATTAYTQGNAMNMGGFYQIQFPASSQVLGLKGWDDGGCRYGGVLVSCSTPSGSPLHWNMYSPGPGGAADRFFVQYGREAYQYSRRWTARSVTRFGAQGPSGATGAWAAADYWGDGDPRNYGFGGIHVNSGWAHVYGSNDPTWTFGFNRTDRPPAGLRQTCNPINLDDTGTDGGHAHAAFAGICAGDVWPELPLSSTEDHLEWHFRYDTTITP